MKQSLNKILQVFRTRLNSDLAAGTLVIGIVSTAFICLCLGFALDLTKNSYIRDSQNSKAQESVQAAVKTVDSKGSLANFTVDPAGAIPDAVYKVVSEYKSENSSNYSNSVVGEGQHTDDAAAFNSNTCSTRDIYKWGSDVKTTAKMPYMVIKLDESRGFDNSPNSVVYVVEGNDPPKKVAGDFQPGVSYHVVSAEIQDASANLMLGMFGFPCQGYDSKVSAIAFGSQQDLANNN